MKVRFGRFQIKRRSFIDGETHSASVGSLSIDVDMARSHGWSEKAIFRAFERIGKLSRRENALAHRNGRIKNCPCCVCDFKVSLKDLPEEYRAERVRMLKRMHTRKARS